MTLKIIPVSMFGPSQRVSMPGKVFESQENDQNKVRSSDMFMAMSPIYTSMKIFGLFHFVPWKAKEQLGIHLTVTTENIVCS